MHFSQDRGRGIPKSALALDKDTTSGMRQSKTLLTIDERGSRIYDPGVYNKTKISYTSPLMFLKNRKIDNFLLILVHRFTFSPGIRVLFRS